VILKQRTKGRRNEQSKR